MLRRFPSAVLALVMVSTVIAAPTRAQEARTDKDRKTLSATASVQAELGAHQTDRAFLFAQDGFYVARVEVKSTLLGALIELMPDNVGLARQLSSAAQSALRHRMDVERQMAKGDAATIVFKDSGAAGASNAATVYGVHYQSAALGRTILAYYYWEPNRAQPEFFDENGAASMPRIKRPPIEGYQRLGRVFGQGRFSGLEFLAPVGTDVVTPFAARVVRLNWRPKDEGDCVELEYRGTGVFATFAGLSSVSVKIAPGQELEPGTVLARSGQLGRNRPNGLRYELRSGPGDDAPAVDPFAFHLTDTYRIAKADMPLFRVVKNRLDALFQQARDRAESASTNPAASPSPAPPPPGDSSTR